MILFGKRKNKKEVEVTEKIVAPSDIYIKNVSEYVEYYGKKLNIENPVDDFPFYEKMAVPYYNSAMKIVDYVKNKYPDELFVNDDVIEFDYKDFVEQMDDNTKALFFVPNYPELIYVGNGISYAHFHVRDNVIEEAENLEQLPGLIDALADKKINKFFNGLGIVEARDLLLQMKILPRDSELDKVINEHNDLEYLNKKYLESVVALFLVINKNKYSVKRARLFADSLGIEFDFKYYEKDEEVLEKRLIV